MDGRQETDSDVPEQATTGRFWSLSSSLLAALVLPLWGFYALSSLTFQNPLKRTASFNLLSETAATFIRGNSLELGLIMVMFTIAPMALLSAAFVFGPAASSSGKWIERRLALGLNLVLLVLILITIVPLFAV